MRNEKGLILVAVIGWVLVSLFVGWTARGIVKLHQKDATLVIND